MPAKDKKLQQQDKKNRVLAGLQATVADMISELDLQVILEKAVERTAELVGADIVTIHIYDSLTGRVRAAAGHGLRDKKTFQQHELGRGKVALLVASKGEPVIADDVSASELKGSFSAREGVKSAAGFPLKVSADFIGVLFVNYRKRHKFESEEVETLASFGNLAAVAIENANLIEQERRRADAMNLLQQVSARISAPLDVEEALDLIIGGAMRLTGTESGVIHLLDEARETVIRSYEVPEDFGHLPSRLSQKTGMTWTAITTGQTIAVSDITKDERVNPAMAEKGVRAIIGTPLKVEGKTIGVLFLNDSEPHEFTEYEKELLSTLASQAAIAIQNARLFENAQRRIRDLEIVTEVVQVISTRLKAEDLLQTIVSQIAEKLDCTHCTEEKGELFLVPQVTHGVRSEEIMTRRFKLDEKSLAGWVFLNRESLVLSDSKQDKRFAPARERREQPRSMLVAPVKVGDQTIGVISADQDTFGWFSESDRRLVDALAQQAGIAIQRATGLALLQDIGNRIISQQKVDVILRQVVSGAIKLTNTTSGVIYLLSEDGKSVSETFQYPPDFNHPRPRMEKKGGLTRQIFETGKPMVFPDISQDARVNPALYERVRSMVAVPLKLDGEKVIGVLYLNDADLHDFTETEVSLLSTLTSQAAIAIQNARLFETMQQLNAQLENLHQVVQEQRLDKVLDRIIEGISVILGEGTSPTINLYREETGSFGRCHACGPLEDELKVPPRPDGTGKYVVNTGKPLYLDDVRNPPPGCPTVRPESIAMGIKSFAALPLKRQEQIVGVLFVNAQKPISFSEEIRKVLDLFADQAAIAIENARLYEYISQDLERRIQELEVLTEIGRTVSNLGIDQILDLVYEQAGKIIDLSNAQVQIAFYDEAKDEVSFPLAIEQDSGEIIDVVRRSKREPQYRKAGEDEVVEQFKPRAQREPPGLNECVIRTKEPLLIVEDFEQKAADLGIRVWPTFGRLDRPTHSWLGVPMMVADRVIGVISIQSLEQEHAFDEEHQELLATVASQAAVAIENATLYAEMEKRVEERTRAWKEAQEKVAAAERLAMMSDVAAEFAHRMNNLAGTIPLRVNMVRGHLNPEDARDSQVLEQLDGIKKDAEQLLQAAQEIKRSTEVKAPEPIAVNDLLSIALQRVWRSQPETGKITLQNDFAPDLPQLVIDRNKLLDTFASVIRNAVEAMPNGGTLAVSSQLGTLNDKPCVEVEVSDTGVGIPKSDLPQIFGLFFTTKPGGLGFGLWRDRNFLKGLGGNIDVESEVGQGTIFTIKLPVAADQEVKP